MLLSKESDSEVFVKLKIPDWAIGRHILIFAGVELLAVKEARVTHENGEHVVSYLPLKVKPVDGRCSGCSSCCNAGSSRIILNLMYKTLKEYLAKYGEFSDSKPCPFLSEKGCVLGAWIPFTCARSICTSYSGCTEYLDEVE